MKRLLTVIFLMVSIYGFGQSNYLNIRSRYNLIAVKTDSGFHVPGYSTIPNYRGGVWSGSGNIGIDTVNNKFYFYSGGAWREAGSTNFADSLRRSGLTVQMRKGGVWTDQFDLPDSNYAFYDSTLMASVKRLKDTASAIRAAFPTGGGADSSVFATLYRVDTAKANLRNSIAGKVSGSGTDLQMALWNGTNTITGLPRYTYATSEWYPNITIGNGPAVTFGASLSLRSVVGDYAHISSDGNQLGIYGLTGTKTINFYSHAGGNALLTLQKGTTGGGATFHKTVISVDTAVGGPSNGSIHGEYSNGDSTSAATDVGRHMFRGIGATYANNGSFNTFYSTVKAGNTTYDQDHIINWQSDALKTGANTLNIIYHLGILGDSIKAGTVNHRWATMFYDAVVLPGATLREQTALKVPKLRTGVRNYDMFSDSAQTVKMDGNILIGDSSLATDARKTIHLFNGTAPSSNIAGTILYSESGEAKVRDAAGNITTFSPHNFKRIPGGASEKMAWSFYSENGNSYITADMTKALRLIEKLSAEVEELKAQVAAMRGVTYQKKDSAKIIYKGKIKK